MIYPITEALKEFFMQQAVPGGYIEGLKTVYIGRYRSFPEGGLPGIAIEFTSGGALSGDRVGLWTEWNFNLYVKCLGGTDEETWRILSDFVCPSADGKGFLDMLNAFPSFDVDGRRFMIKAAPFQVVDEIAIIPITVTTVKKL